MTKILEPVVECAENPETTAQVTDQSLRLVIRELGIPELSLRAASVLADRIRARRPG
jgi:hypothetical protein